MTSCCAVGSAASGPISKWPKQTLVLPCGPIDALVIQKGDHLADWPSPVLPKPGSIKDATWSIDTRSWEQLAEAPRAHTPCKACAPS